MQRESPGGRQRLLHGRARELVPECDAAAVGVENAARDALVDGVDRLAAHGEQERRIERGWRDRRRLDDGGRLWAELRDPRQHDVADRAGYLVRAVREELCDVERVARRESPDGVDVDVAALGEPGDAVAGEGPDREPLDRGRGREISERDAERMGAAELVVAVGDERETRGGRRSSGRAAAARPACPRPPSARPRRRRRAPAGRRGARAARRRRRVARSTGRARRRSHLVRARRSPGTARAGAASPAGRTHPRRPPSRPAAPRRTGGRATSCRRPPHRRRGRSGLGPPPSPRRPRGAARAPPPARGGRPSTRTR